MNKKTFFDTSVLIEDHKALEKFSAEQIVLPLKVIDELDGGKTIPGEPGWNARKSIKYIEKNNLNIHLYEGGDGDSDREIINSIIDYKSKNTGCSVELISNDAGMRIRARSKGIESREWITDKFKSYKTINAHVDTINDLYEKGSISVQGTILESMISESAIWSQYVLKDDNSSAMAVWDGDRLCSVKVKNKNPKPKNCDQSFCSWALDNNDIPLVSITGPAGSGKTFLSLAAGINGVTSGKYSKMVIVKSVQPVGKDMGYLPGTLADKIDPWLQPVRDTAKALYRDVTYFETMIQKGDIEVVPLAYIRGRTFNNSFVFFDEAQNSTSHEIKTVLTRIGSDSKMVLSGDIQQIDTPKMSPRSCGLSYTVNMFKDSDLGMHIHLTESHRSDLAGVAAKIL
jgi:PhoH-like ATPase